MLVTNVGGLAEIVPHEKVGYVTEKNPKEIANAIADFYNNNREAEFSKNVSIEKIKFSWKTMVDGIVELTKKM
jgi:glycosyltransferase involved in cell wall biosynthesis